MKQINTFYQSKIKKKFKLIIEYFKFSYRRLKMERLRLTKIDENACSLCCENPSNVTIQPCQHRTFCEDCTKRLINCPICRCPIEKYDIQ